MMRPPLTYPTPSGQRALPFVIGVIGDFSGEGVHALPNFAERGFVEIDRDDFDRALEALAPALTLQLPALGENTACRLTFRTMEDFSPGRLLVTVPPLAEGFARWRRDAGAEPQGALLQQLAAILHHLDFLRLEGAWQGLRRLAGHGAAIRVLSATKEEISRDLARAPAFDQSRLFKKIYEDQFGSDAGEPFGLLIVDYEFALAPEHVRPLAMMAEIAAAAQAPLIAAPHYHIFGGFNWTTSARFLRRKHRALVESVTTAPEFAEWRRLRERAEARFLALVLPRVLARPPHRVELAPDLALDEIAAANGFMPMRHGCWMSGAYVLGERIAEAFAGAGSFSGLLEEERCVLRGLPHFTLAQPGGPSEPVGPTEFSLSAEESTSLRALGLLPLEREAGDEATIFARGLPSFAEPITFDLEMAAAQEELNLSTTLWASRFIHHLAMQWPREFSKRKPETLRRAIERRLNHWLDAYVATDAAPGRPLREGRVSIVEAWDREDGWRLVATLTPASSSPRLAKSACSSMPFPAPVPEGARHHEPRASPAYSFALAGTLDDLQRRLNAMGQVWRWRAEAATIWCRPLPYSGTLRVEARGRRFLLRSEREDRPVSETLAAVLRDRLLPAIGARLMLPLEENPEAYAYFVRRDDQGRADVLYRVKRLGHEGASRAAFWHDRHWHEDEDVYRRYVGGFDADIDEIDEAEAAYALASIEARKGRDFLCPACGAVALRHEESVELFPHAQWDETQLQLLRCRACGEPALGVYEEERRGAGWREIVHYTAYQIGAEDVARLLLEFEQCDDPDNRNCTCPMHHRFRGKDPRDDFTVLSSFDLRGRPVPRSP